MQKNIIRLCYRKIIGAESRQQWEKFVFEDSYTEFLMQSQLYNHARKYKTFAELLTNVPGSDKLHFLVSASVTGYLQQLNGIIPDIKNTLGKQFLPFKNIRFEIINSDVTDKSRHNVAINFYSEPLLWHDTVAGNLLVSFPDQPAQNDETLTEMVPLQPLLSIYSIKEIAL
jgi:hypothetical protein